LCRLAGIEFDLKRVLAIEMTFQPSMTARRSATMEAPPGRWIIWAAAIGIFLPFTIGDTGKYIIMPLSLPAIYTFASLVSSGERRLMACDVFVWTAVIWMVAVKAVCSVQAGVLLATASDAVAFIGSYMVGRSFIYGEPAVGEFVKALKVVAIVVIALSLLDTLSGTFFIPGVIARIFGNPELAAASKLHRSLFGFDILRATSTFGHPILYGVFCSVAATIFLTSEGNLGQRLFYFGACLFGCLLSVSSAPIIAIAIALGVVLFDRALHSFRQRWAFLAVVSAGATCFSFVLSNNPLTWLLRNVTADPADAYYRLLIWDSASEFISLSPFVGTDPITWSADDILHTIDSVWLVLSLSYGLPIVAMLLLASLSACGVLGRKLDHRLIRSEVLRARTGFSLVIFLFVYLGLTVHFWGSIWMLWGLCLGIRTSLEEYCSAAPSPQRRQSVSAFVSRHPFPPGNRLR
jgi:hypothetical protein